MLEGRLPPHGAEARLRRPRLGRPSQARPQVPRGERQGWPSRSDSLHQRPLVVQRQRKGVNSCRDPSEADWLDRHRLDWSRDGEHLADFANIQHTFSERVDPAAQISVLDLTDTSMAMTHATTKLKSSIEVTQAAIDAAISAQTDSAWASTLMTAPTGKTACPKTQ